MTLSAERLAVRRQYVGSSEVAALFGLHPWLTRFELWHRKAGNLPEVDFSDSEWVFWGDVLEPAVAEGVRQKTGWQVQKVHRYVEHPTIPGFGASLDYEVVAHERGPGVLEIKTVDRSAFRRWDGDLPMVYQLQVQHQLACLPNRSWGSLQALVGGNRLEAFDLDRHERAIAKLERAVLEFWESIDAGQEPEPDFERDVDVLKLLWGTTDGGSVATFYGDAELRQACEGYLAACAIERKAKHFKRRWSAAMLHTIEDAEVALLDGYRIHATDVAGGEVSYVRQPYRRLRVVPMDHEMEGATT